MALNWLGAAEAAESDAAVMAVLAGFENKLAMGFLSSLRERRVKTLNGGGDAPRP